MSKNTLKIYVNKYQNSSSDNFFRYRIKKTEHVLKAIKDVLFDYRYSKFNPKLAIGFINENKIDPNIFINFLEDVMNYHYQNESVKGKKGIIAFIAKLKKSNKFLSANPTDPRIALKPETNILEFLEHMKKGMLFTDINQNEYIKWINSTYNTGYTLSTLRKYFIDSTN